MNRTDAVSIFAPLTISVALAVAGARLHSLRSAGVGGPILEAVGHAVNVLSLLAALYAAWAWVRARVALRADMLSTISDAVEWHAFVSAVSAWDARVPLTLERRRHAPPASERVALLSGAKEIASANRKLLDLLELLDRERRVPMARRDPVWESRRARDVRVLADALARIRSGANAMRAPVWFWALRLSEDEVEAALATEASFTL